MIIRRKVIEKIITRLQEVHNDSTMKTSIFSEELKQEIKLWRETWVTFPLFDAIEKLKDELERGR